LIGDVHQYLFVMLLECCGSGFSINFGFGSGFSINFGFGSGLFMKNTLEFTGTFFPQRSKNSPPIYLNCRSSELRKKANFLKLYIFTALYLLVGNRT
jgi:hypothetical protein